MPVLNTFFFTQTPAEIDDVSIAQAEKIDQAAFRIFELATKAIQKAA
jgi:hypothetical protein